jgi:hypothetical protein
MRSCPWFGSFDVGEGLRGLVERVGAVDDGSEDFGIDELGDLVELCTAGAHEVERVPHTVATRRSACLQTQPGHAQPQREVESLLAGEVWVRGAGDADGPSLRA